MYKFFAIIIFSLSSLGIASPEAMNNPPSTQIDADVIEYDNENEKVIALGKVEIFREDYLLKADKVIYDKKNDKMFAIGNVYILSPDGNQVYAEFAEIDKKLRELIATELRIRMADDTLFVSNKGKIFYPDQAELDKAVYSPCPICQEDKFPMWQLAAKKVYIDKKEERVSYRHGFFEIYGKPVLYTPYFSHPTPNAKPKSGFLIPKLRYTTTYGQGLYVPYYLRIADDKDLIYAPIFTNKQGIIHTAEYKQVTHSSNYKIRGNYNKPRTKNASEPDNRYFVGAESTTHINNHWNFTTDLSRTSDKSYLRNYFMDNKNYLTSQANVSYNEDRDYATIHNVYFQELRPNISQKTVPVVLPVADYHKEFLSEDDNQYVLDSNLLLLGRKTGSSTKRLSATGGWNKTYFSKNGQQIWLSRRFRADSYNFTHKHQAATRAYQNNDSANNIVRAIPEAELKWQYPFINASNASTIYIEPIANIITSPNMNSVSNVINEDSQEIEISDDNLFSNNRYAGLDRVENGIRGAYGLNGYYRTANHVHYNFLVGQAYRARHEPNYSIDSGLRRNISDVVGRLGVRPFSYLEFTYRFRYDQVDQKMRRNEARADFFYSIFHLYTGIVDYNYIAKLNPETVKRALEVGGDIKLTEKWFIAGNAKQNYSQVKKFLVSSGGSIGYNGECMNMLFSINKDFTHAQERNYKKETSFAFELHLKNIN